jgi:hypothetical protein
MAVSSAKKRNLLENNTRPGSEETPGPSKAPGNASKEKRVLRGLSLSEIVLKPLEWFHYNPDNELFRELKSEDYYRSLEKDIVEAGTIISPVIAMSDGLLIEGESRHIIAKKLYESGDASFGKIPCRVILSSMSPEKMKERLFLGNLSRFEIPYTTRVIAYAQIWPDFFLETTDGSKGNTVTTKKDIAAATGLSESQIKRSKAVVQKAAAIAKQEKAPLSAKHVQKAQEVARKVEKQLKAPPKNQVKTDGAKPDRESATRELQSLFSRKNPAYFDFAPRLLSVLYRSRYLSKENFIALKGIVLKVKNIKEHIKIMKEGKL